MTVIKRYTPPTCTLEIKAKKSPLSRWSNRILTKDLSFQLRFDDPRLLDTQSIQINGDQLQLNLLCDVVNQYVDQFLHPSSIYNYFLPLNNEAITNNLDNESLKINEQKIENSQSNSNLVHLPSKPYLKSENLISHELFFGSLMPEKSYFSVKLTALQLFDLATALDLYQTDLKILPSFGNETKVARQQGDRLWQNVAGIVLTVGLTTVGLRAYYESKSVEQVAITEQTAQPPQNNKSEVVAPLPPPPPPTTNLPQFKPLQSGEKLPPPKAVTKNSETNSQNPQIKSPSNLPPSPVAIKPDLPPPSSTTPQISVPLATPAQKPNLPSNLPNLSNPPNSIPTFNEDNNNDLTARNNPNPVIVSSPILGDQNSEELTRNTRLTDSLNEIKSYFKNNWKAPEQLTQVIQYNLLINQDGEIAQITPIGSLSGIYLDRTNMPLMGEKFISPFNYSDNIKVRLALFPDGKVEVFQQ